MANGLIHRSPEGGLLNTRDLFDRFFDEPFGALRWPSLLREGALEVDSRLWSPRVDIFETEGAIHFEVEVPGLKKDDVQATVEKNVLTISGERKFEKDEKKENYHRVERSYGRFSRSFTLPANVDADKAKADFKDGVLTVELPKSEGAKPKKISIG